MLTVWPNKFTFSMHLVIHIGSLIIFTVKLRHFPLTFYYAFIELSFISTPIFKYYTSLTMFVSLLELSPVALESLVIVKLMAQTMRQGIFKFPFIFIVSSINISSFPLKFIVDKISFIKWIWGFNPSSKPIFHVIFKISLVVYDLVVILLNLSSESFPLFIIQISLIIEILPFISIDCFCFRFLDSLECY